MLKVFLKRIVYLRRIKRNLDWAKVHLKCIRGNETWRSYRKEYQGICSQYAKYLDGKRVVIVGPAPSIDGSAQHDFIESFDIVVRVNEALPIPEQHKADVGVRTDILYHCMIEEKRRDFAALVDDWNLQFLCSAFPNKRGYIKHNLDFIQREVICRYRILPPAVWNKLVRSLNSTPNTGTTAIIDLLSHDIAELYITGFTFYQGGYSANYKGGSAEIECTDKMSEVDLPELMHRQDVQLTLLKQLWCEDFRITADDSLREILGPRTILS